MTIKVAEAPRLLLKHGSGWKERWDRSGLNTQTVSAGWLRILTLTHVTVCMASCIPNKGSSNPLLGHHPQPPKAGNAWHYQSTCVFLCAQYMLFLNDLRLYLVPYLVSVGWFLPCNLTFQLLSMGTSTQYLSVFLACHHLSCSNFLLACQHPWKQTSHTSDTFGSHGQALSCLPWLLEGPLEDPSQPLGNLLAKVFSNKDMD